MGRKRIEMFKYRQVLVRLRAGDAVREIARSGLMGRAIHAALQREHAWRGSYSAVVRLLRQLRGELAPDTTVRLCFAPGEAAQVDFGAGPVLVHPDGKPRRTWAFVMTLCLPPMLRPNLRSAAL